MGAPIVVGQRKNPWQGMLMQMYMTKFAHNLKVKQDELDLEKAKVDLEEKRNFQQAKETKAKGDVQKQKYQDEGRKPIRGLAPPQEGETTNVYTQRRWSSKPPELVKGTSFTGEDGDTQVTPFFNKKTGKLHSKASVGNMKKKLSTKAELQVASAGGDQNATNQLQNLYASEANQSMQLKTREMWGKLGVRSQQQFDARIDRRADNIIAGKDTIESVKQAFGTDIQGMVADRILKKSGDKGFNFILPKAVVKGLSKAVGEQQSQRAALGAFVGNVKNQVARITEMTKEIERFDTRLLNIPRRLWKTRVKGSGLEAAYAAYLKDISMEVNKIASGATKSIAMMGQQQQEEWDRIHDPNLSVKEVMVLLNETSRIGEMRLQSIDRELGVSIDAMKNINAYMGGGGKISQQQPAVTEVGGSLSEQADALIKEALGK